MSGSESITTILDQFRRVNRTFPETVDIKEAKANHQKVFGWLCSYVPEEIIYAAGAFPVRITGYQNETELADGTAYLSNVSCSFSRSCLQMALRGEYNCLDGIIAGSTCDGARRLFDHWCRYIKTPFSHIVSVPRKYTATTMELYYSEIISLKSSLENYLGVQITDDALREAIETYNQSRQIIAGLYALRKDDEPPITGAEMLEVLNAAAHMPRKAFNILAGDLRAGLETSTVKHHGRARIMLVGSVLNNASFIDSIESQGVLVVVDGLCNGIRYFSDPVVQQDNESPLQTISRRYLTAFPCARMFPASDRLNRIVRLIEDYKVDGILIENIRYCVQNAHDLPLLKEKVRPLGVPILALDIEYGTSGSGQVQTRVQAFLEMLETRRRTAGGRLA
jgi:benzoyl-CoA reductase/2-hydroxyglutaryl-CoA dehydratase subunit BcrC/BadD/HgdB